jgi:hypothetical protein
LSCLLHQFVSGLAIHIKETIYSSKDNTCICLLQEISIEIIFSGFFFVDFISLSIIIFLTRNFGEEGLKKFSKKASCLLLYLSLNYQLFKKFISNFLRRKQMKSIKSKMLMLVIFVLAFNVQAGSVIFSDNFESGNLNAWTISGRQYGVCVADVVTRNNSKMGHLYHKNFSEICIEKTFAYDEDLAFSFDFEAAAVADHDYASGEAEFSFWNDQNVKIGQVSYVKATSDYVFNYCASNPAIHLFRIQNDSGLLHYSALAGDLVNNITIDENAISSIKLRFFAYGSDWDDDFISNAWVDNVVVEIPEPTTISLLALGIAAIFRKR